jgi:hypothetical protein
MASAFSGFLDLSSLREDNIQTIVASAAITVALLFYTYRKLSSKPKLAYPPGPPGYFLVKNAFRNPDWDAGETWDTLNLKNSKEYGLVYTVEVPLIIGKIVVIADPELAQRVMVTKNYPKSFLYKYLSPLLGDKSIVTLAGGQEWADKRKAFNPGFSPYFLKGVRIVRSSCLITSHFVYVYSCVFAMLCIARWLELLMKSWSGSLLALIPILKRKCPPTC